MELLGLAKGLAKGEQLDLAKGELIGQIRILDELLGKSAESNTALTVCSEEELRALLGQLREKFAARE